MPSCRMARHRVRVRVRLRVRVLLLCGRYRPWGRRRSPSVIVWRRLCPVWYYWRRVLRVLLLLLFRDGYVLLQKPGSVSLLWG